MTCNRCTDDLLNHRTAATVTLLEATTSLMSASISVSTGDYDFARVQIKQAKYGISAALAIMLECESDSE